MTKTKPRVALIGTGGTITAIGRDPMDIQDYAVTGKMLHPSEMLAMFPDAAAQADVVPVSFKAVPSPQITPADWKTLVHTIDETVARHADLAGIVIQHGTSTLEETAYALNLLSKVDIPVVLVGAQRPASALSTDAAMNLANAFRVASHPDSKGLGVLVLLNDEIQAAREVTKTSTYRLQTFRSPDFGVLGQVDADSINYYRRPIRRHAPDTEFDIRQLDGLPRVDIAYSYAGADGAAVRAFVQAGAKGIVSASLAPGYNAPDEMIALAEAAAAGVVVVQSSRAGSGRIYTLDHSRRAGFIGADNLNPQKARVLLACALTVTSDPAKIIEIFARY
ncbi:MAG: asparaginase [Burkholderiaceae bacterium]